MKRILLALTIGSASLISFTSCTKEYIDYYETVPSKTMIYERTASQWQGSGNTRYIDLSVPELTSYYLRQGIVSVAFSTNNESTYNAIPATIEAVSYSFDYQVGSIRVYMEDPILDDGITLTPPSHVVFKVSLTDADYIE